MIFKNAKQIQEKTIQEDLMDNIKVITKYINFLPEKSIFPPEISKVSTRNIKKFQPDETKCQPFK